MSASDRKASMAAATLSDPRWGLVSAKSPQADGKFYYSVKTTGVYCKPSCGARLARPENVGFHATREDAERAGFRPSERYKSDQPTQRTIHGDGHHPAE